ncbi:redoxin domain-containing protein [Bacillus sp. TL12]|uniref:redoxin domain-containing protein n=1 Tax=Bacillus sp. TL12 TaxID=2894756 RepID=UPI001F5195B5|nr:redoxin domain-containing protein [Bacillus sp. TL12]MCI0766220.1 redoxin domain-containing protein [Bacillus sp. TL12]
MVKGGIIIKKWLIICFISIALGYTIIQNFLLKDKEEQKSQTENITIGTELGNVAPNFLLQTVDGKEVHLTDYKGKKVLLNFWASWCGPCKIEMPDMEKFYIDMKGKGIEVIAINATASEKSPDHVKQFLQENKYTFPVLFDIQGQANATYQIMSIPTSFILDEKGIIHFKHVGPMTYENMVEYMDSL